MHWEERPKDGNGKRGEKRQGEDKGKGIMEGMILPTGINIGKRGEKREILETYRNEKKKPNERRK